MSIIRYLNAATKYISDIDYRFMINAVYGCYNSMSDEEYLKRMFKAIMGQELDLDNPISFNAKLQWLKLYDHNPQYTMLVDKYKVRKHIAKVLGEEYLIPLLGVWDDPDDIDFDMLPNQFVLKCNHNSGLGMCICSDKSKIDIRRVKTNLKKGLRQNYYLTGREWPYKDVPRKIIAEKYIVDSDGQLNDYKFFCFDGKVDNVMIVVDRAIGNPRFYHFDQEWNLCRYNRLCRSLPDGFTIPKIGTMDKMFELAGKLSKGFPHVRIDFYSVDGHIYFGEYTLYNQNGFETGFDDYSDPYLGSLITLPQRK